MGDGADTTVVQSSPFHRFGVRLNKKAETARDRRLTRDEEKRLLDTALQKMNAADHQFVGPLLHDRIIAALEKALNSKEHQQKAEALSLEPKVIKGEDYKRFLKDNEQSTKKLMGW